METNSIAKRQVQMKKQSGFSFIELMIALAIVGVVSAYGYSSYTGNVMKSNRAEAQAELMDVRHRLQRCFTVLGRFNDSANCPVFAQVTAASPSPEYRTKKEYYKIYFDTTAVPTATTYLLHAEAIKAPQTKDTKGGCNNLTVDQNGITLPAECW